MPSAIWLRAEFPVQRMRTRCFFMPALSIAARRATARLRLPRFHCVRLRGTDKGAHEFAVHLRRDLVEVDSLPRKKFACILDAIDSRWLNIDLLKSGGEQFFAVIILFDRASDATYPGEHALADLWQHFASCYNVGNGKSTAWLQHPKRFPQ